VLKEDAEREMQNSCIERHGFREEADLHERTILACADVLGALGRFAPEHGDEFSFTDEALWWMQDTLRHTEDHLDEADTSEIGPLKYAAKQAYLVASWVGYSRPTPRR
jgi:hypothetical protein